MRLCQVTALLSGKKTAAIKALTGIYHRFQKPILFVGLSKRFVPKNDDCTDTFPDETQRVQQRAKQCLLDVRGIMVNLLDLAATQDTANCLARADVVVDDTKILDQVPVTHLLFLEKQLTDLLTSLGAIPTLDPQDDWSWSDDAGYYVTEADNNKTKKVKLVLIKHPPTVEHPAQTESYNDDVVIGKMRTVKFSAALPAQEKTELLDRIIQLRDAVKLAREEANSAEIEQVNVGDAIFDFILKP